VFDDPNLASAAGLVPVVALAEQVGPRSLADEHLSVRTDKGANAGLKVAPLVAGMIASTDSIGDLGLLRHGGMGKVSAEAYTPSTLGCSLHPRHVSSSRDHIVTATPELAPVFQ